MATASSFNMEVDDLVTCGVCLYEYDAVIRKPKFLQCSHTLCLICLQTIGSEGRIICPFCRNTFDVATGVASLPNNSYALRLLKLTEDSKKEETVPDPPMVVNWCLTCQSAEKPKCSSSGHLYIDMTADAIKKLDSLLNLKEELLKTKEKGTNNLEMAIAKRQEIQSKLSHILKTITAASEKVKKYQEKNNELLTQIVSIVEANRRKPTIKFEKKDLFLQELLALVDDSNPNDTPEILKSKMDKYVANSTKQLNQAIDISSEFQFRQKVKIVVKLYDENDENIPTCPLLEKGFRFQPTSHHSLKSPRVQQDLTLISYSIFEFLKEQQINLNPPKQATLSSPTNNYFLPSRSIFVLSIFKLYTPVGEVHIRPDSSTFSSEFMLKLGEFCYNTPRTFVKPIEKAKSGLFVLLQVTPKYFRPSITQPKTVYTKQTNDVGVVLIKLVTGANNEIVGWKFLFPLEGFRNAKDKKAVSSLPVTEIFGHVVNPEMVEQLDKLSRISKFGRDDYTLTFESIG